MQYLVLTQVKFLKFFYNNIKTLKTYWKKNVNTLLKYYFYKYILTKKYKI